MTIFDISTPETEPVTLEYIKTFLRVDHADEDALISDLIQSARERVEGLIGGALISRPRRYTGSKVSARGVFIAHSEISDITALRVVGDEATTEISLSALSINLRCNPPSIRLKDRPSFKSFQPSATTLEVDFIAGYGASPEDVPMPLRQAVLLLLAQSYEYRAPSDAPPTVPMMVDALIMPYRQVRL